MNDANKDFNQATITKPRKPRKERISKKKQIQDKQIAVEDKENIDPSNKQFLSIDIGFKTLALSRCELVENQLKILDCQVFDITSQTKELEPKLIEMNRKLMDVLQSYLSFNFDIILVEMQIGKFAATNIQNSVLLFFQFHKLDDKLKLIHPSHKLKLKFTNEEHKNKNQSNKYNQNKEYSKLQTISYVEQTKQLYSDEQYDKLLDNLKSRDSCDTILQLLAFLQKQKRINFEK